jgi:hypothetical protein
VARRDAGRATFWTRQGDSTIVSSRSQNCRTSTRLTRKPAYFLASAVYAAFLFPAMRQIRRTYDRG